MKAADLKKMSVDALLRARETIDKLLSQRLSGLTRQLHQLDGLLGIEKKKRDPKPGSRRRKAISAKYQGPNGETWAGRGMKPKWMTALIAEGRSREEFAVVDAQTTAGMKKARKSSSKRKRQTKAA